MRETTPRVHLIAEPKVRWHEMFNYLESVGGLDWYTRVHEAGLPISDGEALIEFGGRGCYRSWAPGLNANVTKVRTDSEEYLGNIIEVGHGSVLEHAQYSFVFQDVSRVFTHELVRHRAGVAISQESLRYVRLTDLGFRIPPILEGKRDSIINIVERLEDFQKEMADEFGLDDDGIPFHYKKEVTSALRRLAPIGLSTMMTWSANVRTLRWVIENRTAPGAEEEIRLVFDEVGRKMTAAAPFLFSDYEMVPVDGSEIPAWVPGSSKV